MLYRYFKIFILTLATAQMSGCGAKKSTSSTANSISDRTWTEGELSPVPRTYCNTPLSYDNPITISGNAAYEFRPVSIEIETAGLGDVSDETRPIRHAQFDVTDSSGKIVQCGETNSFGDFSFTIPISKKALSLQIYSRSNNFFNKANVYIAPETNELYKLQYFFTSNKSQSNILLIAEARKTVLAGAFNILDQIHNSFDKLLSPEVTGGISPNLIPVVDLYWEKGFNPGLYLGQDFSLSFFSRKAQKVFILGGIDGDTDYSDTDHFDNSIIIHEYFHFLENNISRVESPGGSHSGNQILDPRLAWSEGAAQFFQAVVTGIPSVLDTRGNSDGSTGFFLKLSLENETTDIPIEKGEGEFREFAVARLLWDMHDSENNEEAPEDFDGVNSLFPDIWEALTSTTNSFSFRNRNASPISISALLNILAIENVISNTEPWYKLLTKSAVTNHIQYTDDNNTPSNFGDDIVFGYDFPTFRALYGQKLRPRGVSQTSKFFFKSPFFSPQTNPLENHPSLGQRYYSLFVPPGTSININLNVNRINAIGGGLKFYIYENDFSSLQTPLVGPVSAGINESISGGANGRSYIILVVLSSRPNVVNPSLPSQLEYSFLNLVTKDF